MNGARRIMQVWDAVAIVVQINGAKKVTESFLGKMILQMRGLPDA